MIEMLWPKGEELGILGGLEPRVLGDKEKLPNLRSNV